MWWCESLEFVYPWKLSIDWAAVELGIMIDEYEMLLD